MRLVHAFLLSAVLALFGSAATSAAAAGLIAGTVSSKTTGNALQGASVRLPGLNRATLTDGSGHFEFSDVPAGDVNVVASYSGFEEMSQSVAVTNAGTADLSLVLNSTDVVTLDKFTVSSVKEGQALSLTQQRNAANAKTVVALDEWGVLPTENVGELFTRLPGVSFTVDEDNLINNVTVRGLVSPNGQSFTRLNIDGMSATGVGGNGRTATLHSFSASGYEQIELISAQTPDKRADALGGQINLKTRSPLALKERRRFNYNLSGSLTPPASQRIDALKDHPYSWATPRFSMSSAGSATWGLNSTWRTRWWSSSSTSTSTSIRTSPTPPRSFSATMTRRAASTTVSSTP